MRISRKGDVVLWRQVQSAIEEEIRSFPASPKATETRSVTLAPARFGLTDYFRRESTVTAIMPTARDAKLLDQPASRPLLLVEGINIDAFDNPIEYSVSRMPTARMRIHVAQAGLSDEFTPMPRQ